jgi:excisionase family DNA binding protein
MSDTNPNPDPQQPRVSWATIAVVAAVLGVSQRSVRTYVAKGLIPAYRIRGSRGLRFKIAEVERAMKLVPTTRAAAGMQYGEDARVTFVDAPVEREPIMGILPSTQGGE